MGRFIRSQVSPAFWSAAPFIAAGVFAIFASRQQAMLKELRHAGVPLAGFDALLAGVPSAVPWLAISVLVAVGLFIFFRVSRGNQHFASTSEAPEMLRHALARAESAERENEVLRNKIAEQYPRFTAGIEAVQSSRTRDAKGLYAAIRMTIANNGAASVVGGFKVEARTVYGADIDIDIFHNEKFDLYVNEDWYFPYTEDDYITKRGRASPIQRGCPIVGIVPCVFRNIESEKEINITSLSVRFTDGVGDENAQQKWWRTT
ncbi:MAG: hypothetical protein ABR508_09110, partial [Candidatus Baltobacteraceae bacterium]